MRTEFHSEAAQEPRLLVVEGLEYAVDDCSGQQRVFKLANEACGFAVSVAMSGKSDVSIDVLCWDRSAALAYGGEKAGELYDELHENDEHGCSVFDRIRLTAESIGFVR